MTDTDLNRALALWGPEAHKEAAEGIFHRDDGRPKLLGLCDSWGAIPPEWIVAGPPSNLLAWIRRWGRWNVVALTENGGELCAFLSGSRKLKLLELLDKTPFAAMLLSGGGNDFLGMWDLARMVKPRTTEASKGLAQATDAAVPLGRSFLTPMFDRLLVKMEYSILDLLEWIERSKANCGLHVFHHTYDFVWPSDVGAAFLGDRVKFQGGRTWLKPYLEALGWTDPTEQRRIIRFMLIEFKRSLWRIGYEVSNYHVVDTQGTLKMPDAMADEIHANSEGFRVLAEKVEGAMLELVPEAKKTESASDAGYQFTVTGRPPSLNGGSAEDLLPSLPRTITFRCGRCSESLVFLQSTRDQYPAAWGKYGIGSPLCPNCMIKVLCHDPDEFGSDYVARKRSEYLGRLKLCSLARQEAWLAKESDYLAMLKRVALAPETLAAEQEGQANNRRKVCPSCGGPGCDFCSNTGEVPQEAQFVDWLSRLWREAARNHHIKQRLADAEAGGRVEFCTCGHLRDVHVDDGCSGYGYGPCNCPGFQLGPPFPQVPEKPLRGALDATFPVEQSTDHFGNPCIYCGMTRLGPYSGILVPRGPCPERERQERDAEIEAQKYALEALDPPLAERVRAEAKAEVELPKPQMEDWPGDCRCGVCGAVATLNAQRRLKDATLAKPAKTISQLKDDLLDTLRADQVRQDREKVREWLRSVRDECWKDGDGKYAAFADSLLAELPKVLK